MITLYFCEWGLLDYSLKRAWWTVLRWVPTCSLYVLMNIYEVFGIMTKEGGHFSLTNCNGPDIPVRVFFPHDPLGKFTKGRGVATTMQTMLWRCGVFRGVDRSRKVPQCLSFCYSSEQLTCSLRDVEAQRATLLETQLPRCDIPQLPHL